MSVDIAIEWNDGKMWNKMEVAVLLSNTLQHSINLFSKSNLLVRVQQGGFYIVNNMKAVNGVKCSKAQVFTFEDVAQTRKDSLDKPLGQVGFVKIVETQKDSFSKPANKTGLVKIAEANVGVPVQQKQETIPTPEPIKKASVQQEYEEADNSKEQGMLF